METVAVPAGNDTWVAGTEPPTCAGAATGLTAVSATGLVTCAGAGRAGVGSNRSPTAAMTTSPASPDPMLAVGKRWCDGGSYGRAAPGSGGPGGANPGADAVSIGRVEIGSIA